MVMNYLEIAAETCSGMNDEYFCMVSPKGEQVEIRLYSITGESLFEGTTSLSEWRNLLLQEL
jgi:hypothetical protein